MTCQVENCTNKPHSRDHCLKHYREFIGTDRLPYMRPPRGKPKGPCVIDGCDTEVYAKKMCSRHYNRKLATGSPDGKPRPTPDHGTHARWSRGCRCDDCIEARRQYDRDWAAKTLATRECGSSSKYCAGCRCNDCYEASMVAKRQAPHGKVNRYNGGCRCDECKAAYSAYKRRLYEQNKAYQQRQLERSRRSRERANVQQG